MLMCLFNYSSLEGGSSNKKKQLITWCGYLNQWLLDSTRKSAECSKRLSLWTEWSVSLSSKDDLLFVKLPPKWRAISEQGWLTPAFNYVTFSSGSEWRQKEKPHASSRRRCSWIRKLLNQRSRRTPLRGASFIFIWAALHDHLHRGS